MVKLISTPSTGDMERKISEFIEEASVKELEVELHYSTCVTRDTFIQYTCLAVGKKVK